MKINKTTLYNFIFSIMFIAGFLILIYPWVFDYINHYEQMKVINEYESVLDNSNDEIYEEELEKARTYNTSLRRYYSINEANIEEMKNEEYNQILDLGGMGVMGVLEIPIIDVELPIYHGTDEAVLQIGVGHLEGSSLPVGGESTHSVLTGHTGLPTSKLLSDADMLEEGDQFYIEVLHRTLAYEVIDIKKALPDETESLNIVEGEDLCTIITCTPYGINTHRLLITGKRTTYVDLSLLENEVYSISDRLAMLIIGIAFLIFILLRYFYKKRIKRIKM